MSTNEYTVKTMMFDLFMIMITGGLWIFWLAVRFMRTH